MNNVPPLAELERLCQKPDYRLTGNWMARRVARPLALRVTQVALPLGVSAHAATFAAWLTGLAAAAAFAWGSVAGWLIGAALLQLWYLLDHVDGQIARYRGTASLDGVQLDYLMHHTLNLLVPVGIGWGLAARHGEPGWLLSGLAWGLGTLVLALLDDTRYKAFVQRLKRVRGRLDVVGAVPRPVASEDRPWWAFVPRCARKLCEAHVTMNLLALLAVAQWCFGATGLTVGGWYLTAMSCLAPLVAVAALTRSLYRQSVENEFARWYQPPAGTELSYDDGWWYIVPAGEPQILKMPDSNAVAPAMARQSRAA
jgi:hypothetical protein